MDPVEGLLHGFQVAFAPEHILAALIGALAGTIIGLLPGIGAPGGAAILLPLTLTLGPTAGVIMIEAIYYGVMYGGSTTAVLLNIPGEPPSIVSAFEGYPMSRAGRAGPALGIIAIASFIAGTSSVVLVALFSPAFAQLGLRFGSAEFFALTLGGLLLLSRLVGNDTLGSLMSMGVGLILGTVGQEGQSGISRFTFGRLELLDGVSLIVVVVGLFGVAELMRLIGSHRAPVTLLERLRVRDLIPSREELGRSILPWGRGGAIGFLFGLFPGPSAAMATFVSYKLERSVSKRPEQFGKGAPEGLAGPEAANNAAATSSIVPVLALGIPFSPMLALMLAALIMHNIIPGPLLMTQHPDIFWGVIASMFVGNAMLFVLNVPFIGVWVSMLRIPTHYLLPAVCVLALVGGFSVRFQMWDVYMVTLFGVAGYFLQKYGFALAPMVVALILAPMMETHFRQGLTAQRGDITHFLWSSPIVVGIWLLIIVVFFLPLLKRLFLRVRSGPDQRSETPDAAQQ